MGPYNVVAQKSVNDLQEQGPFPETSRERRQILARSLPT